MLEHSVSIHGRQAYEPGALRYSSLSTAAPSLPWITWTRSVSTWPWTGAWISETRRVLLASYTWSEDAQRWGSLTPADCIAQALENVALIHPQVTQEFEVELRGSPVSARQHPRSPVRTSATVH
jgi:hypothetical protein